jgi:uncharacterized protein (DUF1501 family)
MINRRDVLKGAAASAAMISVPGTRLRVAHAATGEQRLAVLILRGGLDGLSVVPPYGDPTYYDVRPRIAVPSPNEPEGALDLDGQFALNRAMLPIFPFFRRGELLFVQAVGTQHHTRSHFDAQDMLENGTSRPHGTDVGWLNRALDVITPSDGKMGLALGHTIPLLIRGPTAVRTWAPGFLPKVEDDFLDQLSMLYSRDKLFQNAFAEGRNSVALSGMVDQKMARKAARGRAFSIIAGQAGKLLGAPNGPKIATLESTGWDTHVNQVGSLKKQLADLAQGLVAFRENIGAAWENTVVIAVSEFGRTIEENGSGGTDHGTGGIALLMGGRVAGGRVAGNWPGLVPKARFEGRDLMPTTNVRSLFKGVLRDHLRVSEAALESTIFPESQMAPPIDGLIRRA